MLFLFVSSICLWSESKDYAYKWLNIFGLYTCIVFIFLYVHQDKKKTGSTLTCHKPYFLNEMWIHFVLCCSMAGLRIMQNVMLRLHWKAFCIFVLLSCMFSCVYWRWNRDHLLASFDSIRSCLALSVFVYLSDPCVAPSPASSFSTPYQKRERTLNARMYHPRQFTFHYSFCCFSN